MKKRILLFLLNRFGKKKENRDNGGKTVAGIGCLSAILFGPFLTIFLFLAIIVLVATSLFSCAAKVVLSDVLGVEISEEDERMLRNGVSEQKTLYDEVGEYFRKNKLTNQACIAQSFYLLYLDRVTSRDTYLSDLAYCFSDGVKLRTIQRVRECFGIELTDEDMDFILAYARDTHIPTVNYRNYKNAADLAKFAKWTTEHWEYYPNTSGDILTVDKIYQSDNPELWMMLGQRTADNTGIYKAYLWLNQATGDVEPTEGNTMIVNRNSTGVEILKHTVETFPMEDIEWVKCLGLGVIRETTGDIGILTEDGVVTATKEGIREVPFQEKDWSKAFLFPEISYEDSIRPSTCTVHAKVYSTSMTYANLELRGQKNRIIFTLYFVNGVAEVEADLETPDTLTAHLFSEINGAVYEFYDPEPEYGLYRTFDIGREDDYFGVEYVID